MIEEFVDILNENGQVVRQAAKSEAHRHGWLHAVVIGYVRVGDDWVLIRQAADKQDAGQLVAPVGRSCNIG